jgi:hypothetical protein
MRPGHFTTPGDPGPAHRVDTVQIDGDRPLVDRLSEPIRSALAGRTAFYRVTIDGVGRCGEVIVAISGAKGRLPLLFGQGELDAGYVRSVVQRTVETYNF